MNRKPLSVLLMAVLSGCSFAPHYARPATSAPANWKPVDGWQPAQPADQAPRGDWWTLFNDPILNDLIVRANTHNNTLLQAAATYRQAHATTAAARANLFPTIGTTGQVTHTVSGGSRTIVNGGVTSGGNSRTSDNYTLNLTGSWTPDLFGSVRNAISNDKATEQAQLANLAAGRLALQGELASDYLSLRAADAELVSLAQTVKEFQHALEVSTNQYNAKIVAHSDVWQAQSQLYSAQSQYEGQKQTRAQFEDAIAVMVGENPATFHIEPAVADWAPVTPDVPLTVPSTLVQRRPDIAAAERQVAAANAEIGVARAAFFPSLGLSGSGGFNNNNLANLVSASALLWSLGAQVSETLIDFGARSAKVREMRAAYDAAVANYREVTLTAFQGVQDNLAATIILARQEKLLRDASDAADKSARALLQQYEAGTIDYTSVATAQATALQARVALIQNQLDRQNAAVALIQALGGGWEAADIVNGKEAARAAELKAAQPYK